MYEQYGENKVASIGKFGTNKTKGTIRDMCKVLDIPLKEADNIAKSFENYELDEILSMISGEIPKENTAAEAIKYVETYPELFDYVKKLNGLPKSFGLHACGKIISTRDLDEFLPSCYDSTGVRFLQGDMHDVENVGLVKVDVLGLRTLDQEYDTLEMSKESKDFLDPKQNFNDKKVLDIFRNGDTAGIFQFSSNGMKQTLKKMNISGIEDLSIANALFRPGSMKYIDSFCKRKSGEESFEYLHPDLEPILKSTYGIMVFQEQLIEIGRLAKIHNPDLLRKATGKKNPKLLAQVKPELEEKLKLRGWTQEQFDTLWNQMLEFAKYSFNKSHAAAYAIIAYLTAKQKAYYPAEFYAGLCNSYIGKSSFVKDNADEIMSDVENHGIKIEAFNFRNDHRRCSVKDGRIIYGIPLIKDCSEDSAEIMYNCSDKQYKNFVELLEDLISGGVTKNQIDIFIKLGFFSEFGNSKQLLKTVKIYEFFNNGQAKSVKKNKVSNNDIDLILKKYCQESESQYNITNEKIKNTKSLIQLINKKIKSGEPESKYSDILREYNEIVTDEHKSIMDNILEECISCLVTSKIYDFAFKEKIADCKQYLGFINLTTNNEADRRKLLIKKVVPLKSKSTGVVWGYAVFTMSIGSGKSSRLTVKEKIYKTDPINEMDIIYATSVEKNKSGYWYLVDYYKIF
jgi:DNA polymerase-3 subunit alpha